MKIVVGSDLHGSITDTVIQILFFCVPDLYMQFLVIVWHIGAFMLQQNV